MGPQKRPSLGPNACLSVPPTRSRQGSEDWVVQTRTLSIDGPLTVSGVAFASVQEVAASPAGAERGSEDTVMVCTMTT